MNRISIRPKGLYIVSEAACLNSGSGARRHIDVGLQELEKQFDITLLLFCKSPIEGPMRQSPSRAIRKNSVFRQALKWAYVLVTNHIQFFSFLRKVRSAAPDFIYERASYLNFNGLLISKFLRIPHMYEVNGITSDDNAAYYPRVCNAISRRLEKLAYNSTFGFYVGGINESLNVNPDSGEIIQNGIEATFVGHYSKHINQRKKFVELVFVGHAMSHHKLEIFFEALSRVINPSSFRLHLVGSNFKSVPGSIRLRTEVIEYGVLTQDEIQSMLGKMNVAVIPYAKDYFSHVKLFMYGAAKLAVILPETRNYKRIFSASEVIFVESGNVDQITEMLNDLESNSHKLSIYGSNLYSRVKDEFTWERIYEEISLTIVTRILKRRVHRKSIHESSAYP